MSNAWLNRIARSKAYRGAARAVLRELADMANEAGQCWPSLATLAQRAGFSRRHVMRVLRELQQGEEIRVHIERRRIGAAQNLTNLYTLQILAPEPAPAAPQAERPASLGLSPGDTATPGMATPDPQDGDGWSPNPSVNPPSDPSWNRLWAAFLQSCGEGRIAEPLQRMRAVREGGKLQVHCPAELLPLLEERLGAYIRRFFAPYVDQVDFVAD